MCCAAHGLHVDIADLRVRFSVSSNGVSLRSLMGFGAALNMTARPVKLDIDRLDQLKLPCILHWDLNHFVVLSRTGRRGVTVFDPALGKRQLSLVELGKHFTGVALELTPTADFKPKDLRQQVALSSLTGRVLGLKRSLLHILGIALALEAFAIAGPFFNQLVMDEAIATYDVDLLTVLVLGFGLLLLTQTALGLARSWLVLVLGQSLKLQWAGNVFGHLVRLPVSFFERRHMGDIISRFHAVETIQKILTTSLIEAVLDGIMAIAALVLMWFYSPMLMAVVLAAVLLYGLLRWAAYKPLRDASADRLLADAREQSNFLETLRAIVPLKLFGREQDRRARWQNLVVDVQNHDLRTAKMGIAFTASSQLINGLENLVVISLGARMVMASGQQQGLVMSGVFTVGMLFAFVSYKTQFSQRVKALIDYAVDIRMLSLHAERLGDLVLTAPEPNDVPDNLLSHLAPSIELRAVSFRYASGEPWVVQQCSLLVPAGQNLALTGVSGCGKTTLLKLMLGLLTPTEGEVLYGGVPVRQLGLQNFRRVVGTVMQEDVLLSGSVAENVACFDLQADHAQIELVAQAAAIHEDIVRMPMGYQTLIGDMGSTLSGGQKQRLMLARALYKQPRVLALDEATSHLDVATEQRVAQALAGMHTTRIVIAHRPETIARAERVVVMTQGRVLEALG